MPRQSGCLFNFAGCGVALVVVAAGLYALDTFLVAPWAHGDGARLTRTWVGPFVTPSGKHGVLELTLEHETFGRHGSNRGRHGRGGLYGTARSCGLIDWPNYSLTGTANTSGSDVNIVIAAPRPAPAGSYWHELRGAWSGDTLRLSGVLASYAGTTSTYHGGVPDENQPTHLTLRPGADADFDQACARQR